MMLLRSKVCFRTHSGLCSQYADWVWSQLQRQWWSRQHHTHKQLLRGAQLWEVSTRMVEKCLGKAWLHQGVTVAQPSRALPSQASVINTEALHLDNMWMISSVICMIKSTVCIKLGRALTAVWWGPHTEISTEWCKNLIADDFGSAPSSWKLRFLHFKALRSLIFYTVIPFKCIHLFPG